MGIRRVCSYQVTFQTPKPTSNYSDILVTFGQRGQNLINKTKYQLDVAENRVTAQLTQEETALFEAGYPAQVQIRCFGAVYDAPGSAVFSVDVWPSLNDTILGGTTEGEGEGEGSEEPASGGEDNG